MVTNNICESCIHGGLCKLEDKISVFDENKHKPLGIDITIDSCNNFEPLQELVETEE